MSTNPRKKPSTSPEAGPPLSPLPPKPEGMGAGWRFVLPLFLLLFVVCAGLHAAWVPIGATGYQNAPDEAAHVVMAKQIASGILPTQETNAANPVGYEWHQPPAYYWIAGHALFLGERGVRAISILLGLLAIFLVYRVAGLLFPEDPAVALVATGMAALTPTHIAIASTVNNDILLEVAFSWTLLLLIASLRGGFTLSRAIWLGCAVGLACLTKATGVLLIPVCILGLFLLWRGGENRRDVVRGAVWAGVIAFAICGWWYVRNFLIYREVLPLQAFQRAFAGTAQAQDMIAGMGGLFPYLQLIVTWTFQSFWAVFGNAKSAEKGIPLFLPEQFYWVLWGVTLCVVAGMTRLHLKRNALFSADQLRSLWVLFATLLLVKLSFFGFVLKYFQAQGRYAYPAMLPICIVFALGILALCPAKYRTSVGIAFVTLLGLYTVLFLSVIAP